MKRLYVITMLMLLAAAVWAVRINGFIYQTPTTPPPIKPVADSLLNDPSIGYIEAHIVDEDGLGLQYANLVCIQAEKRITGAQTDRNGRARIRIPEGRYQVRITMVGRSRIDSLLVEVKASETTVIPTIALTSVGCGPMFRETVILRVTDSKGRPIEGGIVKDVDAADDKIFGVTTDQGLYRVIRRSANMNKRIMLLSAEGYRSRRVAIKFEFGKKTRRQIKMQKAPSSFK